MADRAIGFDVAIGSISVFILFCELIIQPKSDFSFVSIIWYQTGHIKQEQSRCKTDSKCF